MSCLKRLHMRNRVTMLESYRRLDKTMYGESSIKVCCLLQQQSFFKNFFTVLGMYMLSFFTNFQSFIQHYLKNRFFSRIFFFERIPSRQLLKKGTCVVGATRTNRSISCDIHFKKAVICMEIMKIYQKGTKWIEFHLTFIC